MLFVQVDATGRLHLAGSRRELHALSRSLRSIGGSHPLDSRVPPPPGGHGMSALDWERTAESVGLSLSAELERLRIRGSAVELGGLADEIEKHALQAEVGDPRPIEYFPGHEYLADTSTSMIVWIVVPPPAPAEEAEPTTLIGMFLVAFATGDEPVMRACRQLLSETGWHDADSVLGTAVSELVERRWPLEFDPAEVDEAVRSAVAIAHLPDRVDENGLRLVIRIALGEPVEPTSDVRALVKYRLFAIWAFVQQMALDTDGVRAIVVRAEQRAMQAGRSPTAIQELLDDRPA